MNSRIEKLTVAMKKEGIDNILITDPKNMYYLSGFYQGEGYLLIGSAGLILATDSRYTEYANSACPDFKVVDITKVSFADYITPGSALGFEDGYVSYAAYKNLSKKADNLIEAGNLVQDLRKVKDSEEISYIKRAVEITDSAFSHICSYMKKGMSELQIAAEIDCYMKKNKAEGSSFSTVVAAGERGSLPHAIPSSRQLSDGDLVVMDFGAMYKGYCSDMTRTVAVGRVSDECKRVYDTVLLAQLEAIKEIRTGKKASETDAAARRIIDSVYPGTFGHSLGHSVGLDIHESPNLSPKNHSELEVGNVVTVEPGIYIPGLCGVRIEDMVIIKDGGCEILTQSTKELVCVG